MQQRQFSFSGAREREEGEGRQEEERAKRETKSEEVAKRTEKRMGEANESMGIRRWPIYN